MVVDVAGTDDIPEGEARRFVVDRIEIAVVNLGGEFFAVDDICSHAESHLSEGDVDIEDETIECPRHGSVFDVRTGKPRSLPATVPVATWPVKVEGDRILIELEDR
jgi:3-phenylpropionate/trans-cinnamate dioxygenase ferredoxin component